MLRVKWKIRNNKANMTANTVKKYKTLNRREIYNDSSVDNRCGRLHNKISIKLVLLKKKENGTKNK